MSSQTSNPRRPPTFEEIEDLVGPDLYRRNAFRVLGLPIDAPVQAANKTQKLREMQQKLGLAPGSLLSPGDGVLPLSPPADDDAVKRAREALLDPVSSFGHAFFWFWPLDSASQPKGSLDQLSKSHPTDVLKAWLQYLTANPSNSVAMHNAAVLAHALALDFEVAAVQRPLSESHEKWRWWCWGLAYSLWQRLRDDPAFWQRARSMCEAADDRRLPPDIAHELQEWLPAAVLSTTAKVLVGIFSRAGEKGGLDSEYSAAAVLFAVEQASTTEEGDQASVSATLEQHLSLLKKTGWSGGQFTHVLEVELGPTMERLYETAGRLSAMTSATPRQEVAETVRSAVCSCSVVEALLPPDNAQRAAAANATARALLDVAINLGNEDHNWARWLALNDELLRRANDPILRDRLTRTRETLRENVKGAETVKKLEATEAARRDGQSLAVIVGKQEMRVPQVCTCCLGAGESEHLYSDSWTEHRGIYRVNRSISFKFPICRECERHVRERTARAFWLLLLPVVVAGGIGYMVGQLQDANGWAVAVSGAMVGPVAMALLATRLKYSPLGEKHACRKDSIRIRHKSENAATVTFSNPVYGHLFAETNGFQTGAPFGRRYRGVSILGGVEGFMRVAVVAVLGMVASGIAFAVTADKWKTVQRQPSPGHSWQPSASDVREDRSAPRPLPASTPATLVWENSLSAQPQRDAELHRLSAEINEGESRAERLESEIESTIARLESLEREIKTKKFQIEHYERRAERGLSVNTIRSQETIDEHNAAARQYNKLLAAKQTAVAQYENEIQAVNEKVAEYNRRLRR